MKIRLSLSSASIAHSPLPMLNPAAGAGSILFVSLGACSSSACSVGLHDAGHEPEPTDRPRPGLECFHANGGSGRRGRPEPLLLEFGELGFQRLAPLLFQHFLSFNSFSEGWYRTIIATNSLPATISSSLPAAISRCRDQAPTSPHRPGHGLKMPSYNFAVYAKGSSISTGMASASTAMIPVIRPKALTSL